ncbi:MAG: topoisomerase C-terminal repeat-containing protein, partial [Pseudolabrys sp.]
PIVVKNGRYGPYASHAGVNATLPADKTPDTITLDEAIVLLDARAAHGGGSTKRRAAGRKQPGGKAKKAAPAPKKPAVAAAKKKTAHKIKAAE